MQSSPFSSLRGLARRLRSLSSSEPDESSLSSRLRDVFLRTWHLGLTSFGGPAVHFQIFHDKFVEGRGGQQKWVDQQTYQELFAVCQGLPGPASTKMLFCLSLLHAGFIPALMAFFLWCAPGAAGMYALSVGMQSMDETLPQSVYALLSGLNASTVGIVAVSAVRLAEKAIRDQTTRILVIFGACAGLCYNALWYFPVLIISGALVTVIWDGWMSQFVRRMKTKVKAMWRPGAIDSEHGRTELAAGSAIALQNREDSPQTSYAGSAALRSRRPGQAPEPSPQEGSDSRNSSPDDHGQDHVISIRIGLLICASFFSSFIGVILTWALTQQPSITLDLFASMYLAGIIIFGGGPVVIPLLRSYVVDPGWVSGRDFLIGLALIQAFPGPNFNFAVFLGSLAIAEFQLHSIAGAFLGFVGIFLPGLTLATAVQSFWKALRKRKWVTDLLRGVNATAVGLVFTAVYRLWQIGYLTPDASNGQSLAMEPWWVVVATIAYASHAWFSVPAALSIILGGVLGLCWYGAVKG